MSSAGTVSSSTVGEPPNEMYWRSTITSPSTAWTLLATLSMASSPTPGTWAAPGLKRNRLVEFRAAPGRLDVQSDHPGDVRIVAPDFPVAACVAAELRAWSFGDDAGPLGDQQDFGVGEKRTPIANARRLRRSNLCRGSLRGGRGRWRTVGTQRGGRAGAARRARGDDRNNKDADRGARPVSPRLWLDVHSWPSYPVGTIMAAQIHMYCCYVRYSRAVLRRRNRPQPFSPFHSPSSTMTRPRERTTSDPPVTVLPS